MSRKYPSKPKGWELAKLGELAVADGLQTGPFGSQLKAADYTEDGIPIVMPKDLSSGSIALVSPAENGSLCGTGCLRARINTEKALPTFIAAYLGSPFAIQWLNEHAVGQTMLNLNTSIIGALPVPIPPLNEQHRIAEILSSVDEAIQTTRAVVEQTRKVRQGVLKRLLTKGIDHTHFKQTEIGEIPEAWKIGTLPELLREPIRNGYSPVCPKEPTGKWLLSLSALTPDGFSTDGLKPAPLDDPRLAAANLLPNDVLISRSNTPERVGMVGLYRGSPTECYFPDLMMRIRFHTDMVLPQFGAAYLSHLQASGFFAEAASGTSASMVKINRGTLAQVIVPIPSLDEQEEIVCRIEAISEAERVSKQKLTSLEQVKHALISDLLTGRKRVSTDLPMAAE
jgi:type I restriction enzyme S subunit